MKRFSSMGKAVDSLDLYLKDINRHRRLCFRDVSKGTKSPSSMNSGDEEYQVWCFDKDTFLPRVWDFFS